MAMAPRGRHRGSRSAAGTDALRCRDERPPNLRSSRRDLGLLGLEGRLFRYGGRRPRVLRRDPPDARPPDRRAQFAAMVQHGALLGLRHRWSGAGPLLCRSPDRRSARFGERLRAPAAARLLHPVRCRRSRQRGRDHGSLGARGASLQIRLGLRLELLEDSRRRRAAVRRWPLLGADELPANRRPGRRRDQIRRHDETRRQDGHRRHRSSRHRGLHRLEGRRGAKSRRSRRRLQARR